ncbi:MAG: PilZ domain-containing protein [Sphingosinicella sp.]
MDALPKGWSHSPVAMNGEISVEHEFESSHALRRADRIHMTMAAGLRQRGASGVSVQIMDLSTDGFRAATHLDLPAGTDVWLRLPGLEASQAQVVWARGNFIGCAFLRPLHPAVLEMVVAKSQAR